jgi:hypothetical protein
VTSRRDHGWKRATLGSAAATGNTITVWCNSPSCGYRLAEGKSYRAVLTPADLAAYAEKYGPGVTFTDFRSRLRCRHCGSGDVSTIVDSRYQAPEERWEQDGGVQGAR